jgi:NCS1 family nucleobase:cation symporter-1
LAPFLSVAGTIFAYFSIIIISFGDYTRYVKDEQNLKKGNLSLILNLIIFSFFAVFIVVGSDVFLNQKFGDIDRILTNPTDIIGKFDDLQITVVVLFFIIVASASTNLVANFIPSQYSLINFLPNTLTLKSASYIISIIGFLIGLFWLTVLSQIGILSFIDTFSSFFGPIIGLMIADYYLIKKCNLSNKDIYSEEIESIYYYSGGWHIKGAYSLLLGFIFSASTIWNSNLMFLQSYAFIIGVIVSFLTYYFLAKK